MFLHGDWLFPTPNPKRFEVGWKSALSYILITWCSLSLHARWHCRGEMTAKLLGFFYLGDVLSARARTARFTIQSNQHAAPSKKTTKGGSRRGLNAHTDA